MRDIFNNGEFVGFRLLLNEFDFELTVDWILGMHQIYSIYQLTMKSSIAQID
jgi:hypothetical protein